MIVSSAVFLLYLTSCLAQEVIELGTYNIDTTQISCSGPSSGAAMAVQFHVAYSAAIMGVGVFAGGPYWCAQGLYTEAAKCIFNATEVDISVLVDKTIEYELAGEIDPSSSMNNARVFIWHGTLDKLVDPAASPKVDEYYRNFVNNPDTNIKMELEIVAAHTQPTLDYGNLCEVSRSPYMSKCNYDGAFECFDHIYGPGLNRPTATEPTPGQFYMFNQTEFFEVSPRLASFDDFGYVYVPTACIDGSVACRLHVVFHGCDQSATQVGDEYARNAGYNAAGELNNVINLYPQLIPTLGNPATCWDWWGYTSITGDYAIKRSDQLRPVYDMIMKMVG